MTGKICTIDLSAVEVYKLVIEGKLKKFPQCFWVKPEALKESAEITVYFIEKILRWSEEDVKEKLTWKTFATNKLKGMLEYVFDGSPFGAMENAYPGKYKPWEFSYVPINYWNLDTAREATIWLFKEKLHWGEEEIKAKVTQRIFENNGLGGMMGVVFGDRLYAAIDNAYPGRFEPWEFRQVPNNYWDMDTARKATKWLFEEKMKWKKQEIRAKATKKLFMENGLGGMLYILFNYSYKKAIENAYPELFEDKKISQ